LIFNFSDCEQLSAAAADAILRAADRSIRKRGIFTLALSDPLARNEMPAAMVKPTGELEWYLDFNV
jgi:6-phosphogluconolactonase/glucosamine-6-phosphate isomerase/deaminase